MAATLLDAAAKLGVNQQAQTVLIMTAMGESSLSNPDHGDAVDNCTTGVLQKGETYGPRSARLDPATAATAFLTRLVKVPDWESLEPTLAAHAVQGNADPYHYAPFWTDAQAVVAAVTGKQVSSGCAATGNGEQSATTLIAARGGRHAHRLQPQDARRAQRHGRRHRDRAVPDRPARAPDPRPSC